MIQSLSEVSDISDLDRVTKLTPTPELGRPPRRLGRARGRAFVAARSKQYESKLTRRINQLELRCRSQPTATKTPCHQRSRPGQSAPNFLDPKVLLRLSLAHEPQHLG